MLFIHVYLCWNNVISNIPNPLCHIVYWRKRINIVSIINSFHFRERRTGDDIKILVSFLVNNGVTKAKQKFVMFMIVLKAINNRGNYRIPRGPFSEGELLHNCQVLQGWGVVEQGGFINAGWMQPSRQDGLLHYVGKIALITENLSYFLFSCHMLYLRFTRPVVKTWNGRFWAFINIRH